MTRKKVYIFLTLFGLMIGCTLNQQTPSQCMPSYRVISNVVDSLSPNYIDVISGGSTNVVFVQGDYVYTNFGNQFAILEVTNLAEPKLVGCLLLPGFVADINVAGSYAYVATGEQEQAWYVIDISMPDHPVQIAKSKDKYPYIPKLALVDHYLYSSDFGLGLEIFDITNPGNPVEVGQYPSHTNQHEGNSAISQVWDFVTRYPYIYGIEASEQGHKLLLLNISNPLEPYLADSYQLPSDEIVSSIAVSGDYVYVATYLKENGLENTLSIEIHILDVSNPENVFETGTYISKGKIPIYSLSVQGNYLYMADSIKNVDIVDVVNPYSPNQVSSVTIPPTGAVYDLFIAENWLYIAGGAVGLQIIDITDPFTPLRAGYYGNLGVVGKLQVKEDVAHIVTLGEWRMVDISNPNAVVLLGGLGKETLGQVTNVVTKDNYAYLSFVREKESGFHIVDITNPDSPTMINSYIVPGLGFSEIALSGNVLYLSGPTEFIILDISNPLNVIQIGDYQFEDRVDIFSDILVSNSFIIGVGMDGLRFLDISDLTEPIETTSYSEDVPLSHITMYDEYIYALNPPDVLKIFHVQNLPVMKEVYTYQFSTKIIDLSIDNDKLYIALDSGDLLIFQAKSFIP